MSLYFRRCFLLFFFLFCLCFNKTVSADIRTGMLMQFGNAKTRSETYQDEKNDPLYFGRTNLFQKIGGGIFGEYDIYYNRWISLSIYSEIIYNFRHKLNLYKVNQETKLKSSDYYKILKIFEKKPESNEEEESTVEKDPSNLLEFESIYFPIAFKSSITITPGINFVITPFLLFRYFKSVIEKSIKKGDEDYKEADIYYNKFYIYIGGSLGLDIFILEDTLMMTLNIIKVSKSFDMKGKEEEKIHHKSYEFSTDISLKLNLLSFFIFPKKRVYLDKHKKATGIRFS